MPLLQQISRNEQRWAHPEKDLGGLFIRELRGQTFGILGVGFSAYRQKIKIY